MYTISKNERKQHDYLTYPRQFDSHKWYKPIFVAVLTVIFFFIFAIILVVASGSIEFMLTGGDLDSFLDRFKGGYDNMNIYDATGVVVNLGSVALLLPSLILANSIVRDRTFSSYTSSRGGWSHAIFMKSLIAAIIVFAIPMLIYTFCFTEHGTYNNQFSKAAIGLLVILLPLQCIAEEYIFRAFINQTLGSWFRLPIIAIAISSIGFAALHPYNKTGQIAIFATGVFMGLAAWIGRGIEVSSALHIVNNTLGFLLDGFCITRISSEVSIEDTIADIAACAVFVAVIFLLDKTTKCFDKAKYDDAANANEERAAKKARKQAIKDEKRSRKKAKKS